MNRLADIPTFAGAQQYHVTADDYLRMIDAGAFGDAHVELVDGVLTEMSPSHSEHGRLLMLLGHLLYRAYDRSDFVLYGDIVTLFDDSNVRAPDIAVVDTDIGERKQLVPADILLAVEVGGSTLNVDLGRKRIDYASAGIRHYWVVDVEGRRTHCYADPQGADYAAIRVVPFGEAMAAPGADGTVTVT
jgi:Uma2 family endonuclease